MENNLIAEDLKDSLKREVGEEYNRKCHRKENKEINYVSDSNKKKHYSIVNYQKFQSFAGKLDFQEFCDKFFANDKSLINKAKKVVIKEKILKKKNSNNPSPSHSPKKLSHRTDSFFNYTELKEDKFNLNLNDLNFFENSKKFPTIHLKPTPFQLREEENFKYKKIIHQKQRNRSVPEENIFSSLNEKKDKLFTTFKILDKSNKNILPSGHFISSDSLNYSNRNNFLNIFKNSPNKRKSSPTKINTYDSLDIQISHFKSVSSSVNETLKLPSINMKSNINTMRSGHIIYEPRKKEQFLNNFKFGTATPSLFK